MFDIGKQELDSEASFDRRQEMRGGKIMLSPASFHFSYL